MWREQPFADPLWERAMRAKIAGMDWVSPPVPTGRRMGETHRNLMGFTHPTLCIDVRFCLVTASSMSPRKVVNSFLNEPHYGRYPT